MKKITGFFSVNGVEWCGYLMVKKFTRFNTIQERDGQPDGRIQFFRLGVPSCCRDEE